jgi:DNA replication protein
MSDLFRQGLLTGLRLGTVSVPGLFFRAYAKLGLSEIESMLLLHIMYFNDCENNPFPTPEELSARMSAAPDTVIGALERLVRDGLLMMDDLIDPVTGVVGERYNLTPLYEKLAALWADTEPNEERTREVPPQWTIAAAPHGRETAASRRKDLFTVFESEFARPLSPMEYETITGWLDKDQYSDSLILTALKEAVFAGKVHFRYIDRILVEWQKNRITTPEQAKEYTLRFRGGR